MSGLEVFLRDSDAFTWYMERDPVLRSTIVAVAWLRSTPDGQRLAEKGERASRAVPLFRMKVVEPPARLSTPRWVLADDFDLSWHVRRITAPAPGTRDTVLDLARTCAMTAFDPAHPLWEFTLVDGVDGDGAALIMKVHHALTDGVGGMKLALELFDLEPDPASPGPPPPPLPADHGAPANLVRGSLAHDVERIADALRHEASNAGPSVLRALRHPVRSMIDLTATAVSVGRTVAPIASTLSPVMTERGLGRQLRMLTVDLEDLKRAAAAAGGSVNDGFLAAVAGGLACYHERHGATVEELRLTMPISIRSDADPVAGNRITLQRFAVPTGIGDPAERIREIDARCWAARRERSLPLTNAIAGALNLLPSGVVGGMLKHVDFLASNVPGFPFPVYLAGARVDGYFAFGPTIGAALNTTLLTYDGTCCVGVTVDTAAVPDVDTLVECLVAGFDEVASLGRRKSRSRSKAKALASS